MMPVEMLRYPALTVMPALYAVYGGVELADIGLTLIIVRCLDAVGDPLIGHFSDSSRSRFGRRRPWLVAGSLVALASAYFWLRPDASTGWYYFALSTIGVSLGWTLMDIPHAAWMSELSGNYQQRSRVSAYRTLAQYCGSALFLCLPLLPLVPGTEITPQDTAFAFWVLVILMLITLPVAIFKVPEKPGVRSRASLGNILASMAVNRPFWWLCGSGIAASMASGMVASLYYFYLDIYLGILDKFVHVGLTVMLVVVGSVLLWPKVLNKLDRHRVMTLCLMSSSATLVAMFFITPGSNAVVELLVIFSLSAVMTAGAQVCVMALVADVVDFGEWKTGSNRAASYYAGIALVQKLGLALGAGVGFLLSAGFGFDAGGGNSEAVMRGFFLTFIWIPAGLYVLAALLVWCFPITCRRAGILQRRLRRDSSADHSTQPEARQQ